MSLIQLRPYQDAAVDRAFAAWERQMLRPAEVMPTGTGKTVVFCAVALRFLRENPGRRVLVLAHTTELCDQAIDKFASAAPGLRVGRVQARLNETLPQIIVASVQTLRDAARRQMIRNVGLIIVDECHHAVATTYRAILNHYGAMGGENRSGGESARALGFTATMVRSDDLALGDVWQDVVYSYPIGEAIGAGYLVRPRGLHVRVDDLDLSQVRSTQGDYREGDLGKAIEESMAPEAIVKAIAEHADTRKIILFAPTVRSAEVIQDALRASGRTAGLIHGGLAKEARKAVLDDFRAGRTQVLCGCMVLAEGFDEPAADCVVIARPTKSSGLYKQMVGRVVRPYPGKVDALVLDLVGVSKIHSLVGGIELYGTKRAETETDQDEPVSAVDEFDVLAEGLDKPERGQADLDDVLGVDGPLVATEVDLFGSSPMLWHRTAGGVHFLAAGGRYIAIVPSENGHGYDVTWMSTTSWVADWIERGIADVSYAMAWAEQSVTSGEKATSTREKAKWKNWRPSALLLEQARGFGLSVSPFAKYGEVHTQVTIAAASARIDPYIPAYARKG